MRWLRDVAAMFLVGALVGGGVVALITAPGIAAPSETAAPSEVPATWAPAATSTVVTEMPNAEVGELPEATVRTLMRWGAIESSTETELSAELSPAVVEVLLNRRDAMAVFGDSE